MEHDVDNPPLHFSDSATTRLSVRLARKLTTLRNSVMKFGSKPPPIAKIWTKTKLLEEWINSLGFHLPLKRYAYLKIPSPFPVPLLLPFWSGSLEWKRTAYKLGRVVPDPSVRCLNCALHMTSDIPKIWRCHQRRIRPSLLPLKLVRFPLNYSFLLKCDMLLSLLSF